MFSDLGNILIWWLYLLGIGFIFLPITRKIFSFFFDQGYLFSKVLGILFSSYLVWLLASLKILPFYQETIWLVLIAGLAFNVWFASRNKQSSIKNQQLTISVTEELMLLGTLIFWSYIRAFQPDIQGLEKFMDYGFVNSILRSKFFPPADMWFAGKSINYYYFGHYVAAFLTRLTGIPSAITYNLMMATLFALCFSLTFSLTSNLLYFFVKEKLKIGHWKLVILGGLISALLISLGANLHPAYYNFKMKILKKPYCNGSYFYWYPDATRYIGYCPDVDDKTIHEFPSYSFVVSDLHGHVSDIPFVLLFLALSFIVFVKLKESKQNFTLSLFHSFTLSLCLAVIFMTNQWDFPIYLMVLGFVLLAGLYPNYKDLAKTLIKAAVYGVVLVIPSCFFFLPYFLTFEPIAKGIAFVWRHSLPHQLLILWGAPWFFGISFIIFLFKDKIRLGLKKESLVKWFSNTLGVNIEIKPSSQKQSTISNLPAGKAGQQLTISDLFIIILFLVSTILIFIPEIFYVKDIYIPSYHRANTMFKLTYQSFVMFSISIGYVFVRVISSLNKGFVKNLLFTFYFLLFTSLMVYPIFSIPGYYGKLESKDYKGLYGLGFLQRLYPDDYQAILWLNKNVFGQPVILEAVGDSYTDYERISMATGLPTIQGWLVHEWLWRGSFDEPGKRSGEVQQIYETKDLQVTKDLLSKYSVRYVIVGKMEKNKYPNLEEKKFEKLGKIAFHQGETKIYQLF
jgi:YYY domain-containing protein